VSVTLPCVAADEVPVANRDVVSSETHEACRTIILGPNVRVLSPAELTLRARESIRIDNGVEVDDGATLQLVIHPDAGSS
jgi:hypothetical protein